MISDELLEIVAPLADRSRGLPAEVETKARWLVLDTLGCAIAGGRSPTLRSWLDRHGLTNDPYGTPTPGRSAGDIGPALALAMGACWDEACEGHAGAHGRPGLAAIAAVWPSVLDISLGELLRATVVGYEVGARMGAALRIIPGMHVDGNWPSLGAAAAAACGMGQDAPGIIAAAGIAACQLPASLYRPIETGDTARNTYLGHAALLGRMAAQTSAVGISAPPDAIESFARVVYGRSGVAIPCAADEFEILSGYFKEYAAVRHVHYASRSALELRAEISPDRIRSIDVWTYPEALRYCGVREPRTPLQGQFSISFGVAAMLRWGRLDPAVYRDPDFSDALLHRLERAVTLHEDTGLGDQRAARVRIVTDDGQTHESSTSAVRGDPTMPWTQTSLTEKFLAYCDGTLSPPAARSLAAHLLGAPLTDRVFPSQKTGESVLGPAEQ